MSLIDIEPRNRGGKLFAIRIFLEITLGGLAVFVLAAMVGPWLFDMHDNLALAGAVAVWMACPVLVFMLAADVVRLLKRPKGGS